jgi:hypothetical protein
MVTRNVILPGFVIQLLLLAVLPAANPAFADADAARVQLCWVLGKFDNTVYFAEVEGREDRQASFVALIEISGIDHHPVECRVADSRSRRSMRSELIKSWAESEFEIGNTTFMSDLDY